MAKKKASLSSDEAAKAADLEEMKAAGDADATGIEPSEAAKSCAEKKKKVEPSGEAGTGKKKKAEPSGEAKSCAGKKKKTEPSEAVSAGKKKKAEPAGAAKNGAKKKAGAHAEKSVTDADTLGGAMLGGDVPGGDVPCGAMPCGDVPCGDVPCGDAPCGDAPCGDVPCGDAPCGDAPGGDVPGGDVLGDVPGGDVLSGDAPCGDAPGGDDRRKKSACEIKRDENGRFLPGERANPSGEFKVGNDLSNKYDDKYCTELIEYFSSDYYTEKTVPIYKQGRAVGTTVVDVPAEMPSMVKFAMKIGVTDGTLRNWRDKHERFAEAYERAKALAVDRLIALGLIGQFDSKMVCFLLSSTYGFSETVKQKNETSIKIAEMDDKKWDMIRRVSERLKGKAEE